MKRLKIKFNWKAAFATIIVALFAASLSMDFYLYDRVKENKQLIENIIDNS